MSVVCLTIDLYAEGLRVVDEAGGLVWCWNQESLARLAVLVCAARTTDGGRLLAAQFATAAAGLATVTVLESRASEILVLDSALARGWPLSTLSEIARRGDYDTRGGVGMDDVHREGRVPRPTR